MTDSGFSYKELLERARQRDPDAIASLYREHVDTITRYIGYRVSDQNVIEDLTANVFLKMVEKLPDFRYTGAPFEAWLYRIAATQVADYYRIKARRPVEALTESLVSDQPTAESIVQQTQEFESLHDGIGQLNEEQQTILFLRFVERKSHDEVGQILAKSARAVATAQHRALKHLASLLKIDQEQIFEEHS